jgi:hypothetical protein
MYSRIWRPRVKTARCAAWIDYSSYVCFGITWVSQFSWLVFLVVFVMCINVSSGSPHERVNNHDAGACNFANFVNTSLNKGIKKKEHQADISTARLAIHVPAHPPPPPQLVDRFHTACYVSSGLSSLAVKSRCHRALTDSVI